jgi:hypothetical protein
VFSLTLWERNRALIRVWIAMSILPASINLFESKLPDVRALFEKYRNDLILRIMNLSVINLVENNLYKLKRRKRYNGYGKISS